MNLSPSDAAPTPIPSGTITFVFTDIEGSTQRWDRDRPAMEAAVRRHDTVMREAIAAHAGHVFKTIGDAFCAAFARPEEAIAAILEAQVVLASEDFTAVDGIRVRAAIHTGTADERDGDYFGPAVNRVARLLAIGHGGQVLVSGVTSDLAVGDLPPRASLRDLGAHRLRDLARPEQVYQLQAPGLIAGFPQLRSLDALPNNLPRTRTTLIGREKEVGEITALVEGHHLVTVVGSGGVGKTRTSLQVAANLLDMYADGVWFVELAPLASGDYIPTTIAKTIDVTLGSDGDPLAHLVRALAPKRALFVFDNCEHVVEAAARIVAAILDGCPNVRVLASSLQGLGLAGEATYRMPSLVLPNRAVETTMSAVEAMQYPAIALFVERAGAASYGFALTGENAALVTSICRRLDGIPLAIELAAPRIKSMSLQQLSDRLDERFRMLTGGSRDVLPRQQTLRALIDWSHDLLDERERALFRRLGIFVDGFTFEGANMVGSGDELDEFDIIDVLASLVDKSLVIAEPATDGLRYRLLESTRAYALEKLKAAGEHLLLETRHLRYLRDRFVALREYIDRTVRSPLFQQAFAEELEDIRAALEVAPALGDAIAGAEILGAIGAWNTIGFEIEGIGWCERYLEILDGSESVAIARLYVALSTSQVSTNKKSLALESALASIPPARKSGDTSVLAEALSWLSWTLANAGRLDESEAALVEAQAISGVPARIRIGILRDTAMLAQMRGEFEPAIRGIVEIRKELRALGNRTGEIIYVVGHAEAEHERHETARAIDIVLEVLPEAREARDTTILSKLLTNLTAYYIALGDVQRSATIARESLELSEKFGPEYTDVTIAIEHVALASALHGDIPTAMKLEGYVDAAFRKDDWTREYTEQHTHERVMAIVRDRLEASDLERYRAEGEQLEPEHAVRLARECAGAMLAVAQAAKTGPA